MLLGCADGCARYRTLRSVFRGSCGGATYE